MKDNIKMDKLKEMVHFIGMMGQFIMDNGIIVSCMVKEYLNILMEEFMKVISLYLILFLGDFYEDKK